jgi:hypothetical protein
MELFIPSLLILLLAGLVTFAILPRFSPLILVIITVIMLAVVGYQHHVLFAAEWSQSTWQESVKNSAMPFLIAMVVLFMLGFILNFIRTGSVSLPATSSGPSYNTFKASFPSPPRSASNLSTGQIRSLVRNP